MTWSPNTEALTQILAVLRESIQAFAEFGEWAQYLAYILARCTGEANATREFAGLLLKNFLGSKYDTLAPTLLAAIKAVVLECVGDSNSVVRKTAAQLVSAVLLYGELDSWPELLPALVASLSTTATTADTPSPQMEGALQTMALICEDHKQLLDEPQFGRPLQHIAPRMLALLGSPHEPHRLTALSCICEFLVDFPGTLVTMQAQLLQGLLSLGTDVSWRVRARVCRAFITLAELHIDVLLPALPQAIALMIATTQDADENVSLEACEFWQAVSEHPEARDCLRPALAQVVPLLLSKMVYTQSEAAALLKEEQQQQQQAIADPKDVKPQQQATGGSKQEDDGDDEGGDEGGDYDEPSEWNIRKCAAAGLDYLSNSMGEDVLPVLMQCVVPPLSVAPDAPNASWVHQECAILALGAVAEGCAAGMQQHLPQLLPFLIAMLGHSVSIVRSITCWTLSRYSRWVVEDASPEKDPTAADRILKPLLVALLTRIHDPVRRVQEAASSALATLEEEAGSDIVPYGLDVLRTLMDAYVRYEQRGLLILYDAIGTLAESLGPDLARPEYTTLLMPPLIARWNAVDDADSRLVPLLECLSSIASALGIAFQQYAEPVFQRCVRLIKSGLAVEDSYAQQPTEDQTDRDLVICSLDMLAGMCGALGQAMDTLISGSGLVLMIAECMRSPSSDVRQSACALVGDLSRSCFAVLRPNLARIVPLLLSNIVTEFPRICANASWAFGEVAVRAPESVAASIPALLVRVLPIVQHPRERGGLRIIVDNAAACLGRVAIVAPAAVAPQLASFVQPWCSIVRGIRDDREKVDAMRGLCELIKANPNAVVTHLFYVLQAFASLNWDSPHPERGDLFQNISQICHGFKSALADSWAPFWSSLSAELKSALQKKYQL